MIIALFAAFLLNLAVVVGFPSASIFYMTNVGLHLVLGTAVVVMIARKNVAAGLSLATGLLIAWMAWTQVLHEYRWFVWVHVAI